MCVTSAPAILSGTLLYAAEAMNEGRYIHVLGYQNRARSLTDRPNAMLLPFPTSVSMGRENVLDTTSYPGFLLEYRNAIWPPYAFASPFARGLSAEAEVFEVGSYTVVLAKDADDILPALERVRADRRPDPNPRLYETYRALYPGQPVALCCWTAAIEPEPLLWWYEPRDPDNLWLPALDAHDGGPPRAVEVAVDHRVFFGSLLQPAGALASHWRKDLDYTQEPLTEALARQAKHLLPFLADRVVGRQFRGRLPNGDFSLPVAALRTVPSLDELGAVRDYSLAVNRIAPVGLALADA